MANELLKRLNDRDTSTDPFDAVPIITPGVDAVEAPNGELHLRLRLQPQSGLSSLLSRGLGLHRDTFINLDTRGSCFWKQIDNTRSLAEIEIIIRRELGMPIHESRIAVLKFTKSLMQRGLIQLKVETPSGVAGGKSRS